MIMDRHRYYGLAVAQSQYAFRAFDLELGDDVHPSIRVHYLHALPNGVLHNFNLAQTNPAAFSDLDGAEGFPSAKTTFEFLDQAFPEALDSLESFMDSSDLQKAIKKQVQKMEQTPNVILYGPPGTGKTYNSIEEAVRIVNPGLFRGNQPLRDAVKVEFDRLRNLGQIEFITFHQSLGYEDFVEGIKPVSPDVQASQEEFIDDEPKGLSYKVQDGIFKEFCTKAAFSYVKRDPGSAAMTVLNFNDAYDKLIEEVLQSDEPIELGQRNGGSIRVSRVSKSDNLRMIHADGEREHIVSKDRLTKLNDAYPHADDVDNIRNDFKRVIGSSNYTAYWAALNAVQERMQQVQVAQAQPPLDPTYTEAQIKQLISKLQPEDYNVDNPNRFVIIIDEINRGNVSSIFGELITLLEDDKRLGKPEALKAKLPYSGDNFGVPPNVYIIGTMNTADRSVEALDTALRRRFSFVHKGPEYDGLSNDCEGVNLKELLRKLNRRLTILLDADHTIGHAWLWNVQTLEELRAKFKNKILPLMQEYFYNDYEKLGLVLGDAFFHDVSSVSDNELAAFSKAGNEASDYTDKVILELKDTAQLQAADFKSIYSNVTPNVSS